MQIRELTEQQIRFVYEQYFREAFPRNEIRPWKDMANLFRRNAYVCYGNFDEEGKLCTYAFFFRFENVLLLDYLASVPEKRSLGLGGAFLQGLLERLEGTPVLGEVEEPSGGDPGTAELRRRRVGFYRRNGFAVQEVCSRVYGQTFRIIAHGWNGTAAELAELLKRLYPALMSCWRSRLHVKVWEEQADEN